MKSLVPQDRVLHTDAAFQRSHALLIALLHPSIVYPVSVVGELGMAVVELTDSDTHLPAAWLDLSIADVDGALSEVLVELVKLRKSAADLTTVLRISRAEMWVEEARRELSDAT